MGFPFAESIGSDRKNRKMGKLWSGKSIIFNSRRLHSVQYFVNFSFLHFRVIQQSHPVCNTIMLFGVITCLVSVILLGIDGQFVDSSTYPKVSLRKLQELLSISSNVDLAEFSQLRKRKLYRPPKVNSSKWNINERIHFRSFIRLSIKFHIAFKSYINKSP